jgi:hypothetical protein
VPFFPPPRTAAWQHEQSRSGFEVVFFERGAEGYRIDGCSAAVEDGEVWAVDYSIDVDESWTTRSARISGRTVSGSHSTVLEIDGQGRWLVDGVAAPRLNGCLDVDLESSAMTNALPVRRLGLAVGARAAAPAAYVRALDLSVERLDQEYLRITDDDVNQRYEYAAPGFDFRCELRYDESGLTLAYPGIAVRAA